MVKNRQQAVMAQPLIAVKNVKASSRWYQELLGATHLEAPEDHPHAHIYDRILSGDQLVLQLHSWDDEDHPNLVNRERAPVGHGVLLWFELDDFDDAVARARRMKAEVVEDVHVNPGPRHRELWLRDPDGYVVVVASPDGEAR
jgi:hypothetical protein